jgi:hypothetical protein
MTMIHVRLSGEDHSYISKLASDSDLSIARVIAAIVQDARRRGTTRLVIRPDLP